MLDREQLIEIGVSIAAVALMVAAMLGVASTYGTADSTLSVAGGWMLVWVIVGFIVLLTAIGIGLAYMLNDPDDGLEASDDSDPNGAF
ncbi:hypothetical protein [Natrinema sp. 1APR25-10V2]|uniref:DUF7472 family protein n=1 Tax=Natrinema sp. 1APR25-10V2 TaxID=2951081 RepID=UPI00287489AD|nr:hypothetical protein [Natrinema sp. 1APR25-10V2]MDS0476316.1 hypothetical protein [Natrinema sp. 1APR25-10V2]